MSIYKRARESRQKIGGSNCAGSVFYILGLIPEDEFVDIVPSFDWHKKEHPEPLYLIGDMEKINQPEHGSVILIREEKVMNQWPLHVGAILKKKDGLYATHRNGMNNISKLKVEPLKDLINYYDSFGSHLIEFYKPKLI